MPNALSLVRIISVPICVFLYYLPVPWAHFGAALVFSLAALTDWLDGYVARHWDQTTRFGAFLDPVADKLMVTTILVVLVAQLHLPLLAIPAAIIIGREIVVSALREWMAEIGKRTNVAVSNIGKFKTTAQLLSVIILLLYVPTMHNIVLWLGGGMLFVAATLTLWSMVIYLKAAWPDLTLSAET